MAGINECNPELDGKRAAVDLATARPEDFSTKVWNIDNKLNNSGSEYSKQFMAAMNNELESRHLLPKVELNMISQSDDPSLQSLQNRRNHIETKDLVQAEDNLKSSNRYVEANLVHGLIQHQDEIQSTHAERNFWGKNHGGIDMDRMNRWANQSRPDEYGALNDTKEVKPNVKDKHETKDCPPNEGESHVQKMPKPSEYDRRQDDEIKNLRQQLAHEKEERELKNKIEFGVIKDAHHTVQAGETLRDMACLALHKAGQNHLSEGLIKHEEAKIRMVNGLGHGEHLTPGMSLMLRTREEVEHETARRVAAYEKQHPLRPSHDDSISRRDDSENIIHKTRYEAARTRYDAPPPYKYDSQRYSSDLPAYRYDDQRYQYDAQRYQYNIQRYQYDDQRNGWDARGYRYNHTHRHDDRNQIEVEIGEARHGASLHYRWNR